MKFEIGDSVIGIEGSSMEYAVASVLNVDGDDILITIVSHEYNDDFIGEEFWDDADEYERIGTYGNNNTVTHTVIPVSNPKSELDLLLILGEI